MKNLLDIEKWNRKDLYEFFIKFENPFFNICTELDVTSLVHYTKENSISYFISILYLCTKSANSIKEFKYRLTEDKKVRIYNIIHAGSTVSNNDDSFSFCYFDFYNNYKDFYNNADKLIKKHKQGYKNFNPKDNRNDLIHYSSLPWIAFSSVSHPKRFNSNDSVPKIVIGQYNNQENIIKMPISIEVHHALMDGLHVGNYLKKLQSFINNPAKHLGFKALGNK